MGSLLVAEVYSHLLRPVRAHFFIHGGLVPKRHRALLRFPVVKGLVMAAQQEQRLSRRLLRPKSQCELLGISMPTLYRMAKEPDFPQAVAIGALAQGRFEDELLEYLERRRITAPRTAGIVERSQRKKERMVQGVCA